MISTKQFAVVGSWSIIIVCGEIRVPKPLLYVDDKEVKIFFCQLSFFGPNSISAWLAFRLEKTNWFYVSEARCCGLTHVSSQQNRQNEN